jgi:hypothetical protein
MSSTLIEQLQAARNSLTPTTWHQGSYFANRNNTLCMCSHGALQAQVNPACKAVALGGEQFGEATANVRTGSAATSGENDVKFATWTNAKDKVAETNSIKAAAAGVVAAKKAVRMGAAWAAEQRFQHVDVALRDPDTLRIIWEQRPSWIKDSFLQNNVDYGSKDAHYLLGMVGLTASFNDAKTTTLAMVHQKFDEAIELARQLSL